MSNIYLITGATSAPGLALMGRLLPALAEGDLIPTTPTSPSRWRSAPSSAT